MEKYFDNTHSVCCQGTRGAYSHTAALKIFPKSEIMFVKSFEEVFSNVESGAAGAGILPVENSTAGLVGGIIDLLVKYNLYIIYAKTLDISHMLCVKKGTLLSDVKIIYSHRQALMQCSQYLSALGIEQAETANTAMSAEYAGKNGNTAAVCSAEAAEIFGLEILKKDICNNKKNQTRFIVVGKDKYISEKACVTSLFFKIKNKSGSLFDALKIIKDYDINLSSLHSLPLEDEIWNYGFYADIEGSINDGNVNRCINSLSENLLYIKILGSYVSEI